MVPGACARVSSHVPLRQGLAGKREAVALATLVPRRSSAPLPLQLCKNLVLSGLSVTLHDDAVASAEDLSANFFLTEEDVGKPVSQLQATRRAHAPLPAGPL